MFFLCLFSLDCYKIMLYLCRNTISRPMNNHTRTIKKSMDLDDVQRLLSSHVVDSSAFYHDAEFGICSGADVYDKILSAGGGEPFNVRDYRMDLLVEGEMDVTVNMIQHHVTAGQMIFFGIGSIVQINHIAPGTIAMGIVLSADLASQIFQSNTPAVISTTSTAFFHEATDHERLLFENTLLSIWNLIHVEDYPREVLHSLFATIIHYYNYLYGNSLNVMQNDSKKFHEFIVLVNEHSSHERSVAFYADKLCLSTRYFGKLILAQSGKTAKYWIDAAVITRAKVQLRHSTLTVSQISDELHFLNDSFFCKFFRRLTGMSPSEYRGNGN